MLVCYFLNPLETLHLVGKTSYYEISVGQQYIVHSTVQETYYLESTHLHFMKKLNIEGSKN
jgi:hypothetical protein